MNLPPVFLKLLTGIVAKSRVVECRKNEITHPPSFLRRQESSHYLVISYDKLSVDCGRNDRNEH